MLRLSWLIVLAVVVVAAQLPPDRPAPPVVMPGCAADDPCPDPNRPWMRGNVEKSCARLGQVEQLRREHPDVIILTCACHHMCGLFDPKTGEADGKKFDPRCEARCNPKNCQCRNACDTN